MLLEPLPTSGFTHAGAMGKTAKKKAAEPAPATPAPKRTRPHRTPQNCFQVTEDTLYNVDKIAASRWNKGSRQYFVRWEGYEAYRW